MNALSATFDHADRLIDLKEVKAIVGLGKTRIYALARAGDFPAMYKPGGFSTRWSEKEVRAWVNEQRASR